MNDECPLCDRLLPPDGDCYGCAADKAWEDLAASGERLARAEAVADALIRLNRARTDAHTISDAAAAKIISGEQIDLAEVADMNDRVGAEQVEEFALDAALAAYKAGKESNAG
jgi:hypothetical protein